MQGRKEDVRRPASDDGTWHAGVLGGYPRREFSFVARDTAIPCDPGAIERILYALVELLLLQGLEAGLLEPSEGPADATLHDARRSTAAQSIG